MSHAVRLAALAERLDSLGVDALLVTARANIRYLTGFGGTNGVALVRPDGATFLTDFRYTERAAPLEAYMEVRQVERDVMKAACAHLAEIAPGAQRVGFESTHMTVAQHDRLAAAAPAPPVATTGAVERLREVKDAGEQEAIRRSAALIQPVLEQVAAAGLVGRTEREVAWSIQEAFHSVGADELSFPSIVAAHERGSQPHAEPGPDLIGADTLVTIDLGCVLDGYCSDCTRTFATGSVPQRLRDAYAVCLEAQLAAMEGIRPGLSCTGRRRHRARHHRPRRVRRALRPPARARRRASRSTRIRASPPSRPQPWSLAWSSQWSRASICPGSAVFASRIWSS